MTFHVHKKRHDLSGPVPDLCCEEDFSRLLRVEKRRTERSRRPFLLMLIDLEQVDQDRKRGVAGRIAMLLSTVIRETDIKGWYEHDRVVGVIFTEASPDKDISSAQEVIFYKVHGGIKRTIYSDQFSKLEIRLHVFPEDLGEFSPGAVKESDAEPEPLAKANDRKLAKAFKRVLDVVGSIAAIVAASPLLVLISLAVKLSSKGPALFRQERIGQFGRRFVFLKFRSMYADNDPAIHREFVTRLIGGKIETADGQSADKTYKITHDPRVTPIGRWLRRTSLDELPQFFNVLKGEMSLVGPRPPIPYEYERYDLWHRRRIVEAKPGITGLWQVAGRSALPFDETVRLDIKYIMEWSPWLDIKILLKTPRAVLSGKGAY